MPATPAFNPKTHQPIQNPIAGQALTQDQQTFAQELSSRTGLDIGVVQAWLLAEESGSAAQSRQRAGNNDWLNIGYTGSGTFGAQDAIWRDPATAADATAAWLAGKHSVPGYGTASPGIQSILKTAGQSADAQIAAIQKSGWAASGYPHLKALTDQVAGTTASVPNPIAPITDIGGAIVDVWNSLTTPALWKRVLYFIGGAVLLFWGLKELTGAHVPAAVKRGAMVAAA